MDAAGTQLQNLLSLAYGARMLKQGAEEDVLARFSRQTGLDPEFLPLAETRFRELSGEQTRRCIISKVHKDFLEKALKLSKEIRQ